MDQNVQIPNGNQSHASTDNGMLIESLGKLGPIVLVSIYVVGFLTLSLRDALYGFSELDPLRPRILSAGTWFLVFAGLPVIIAAAIEQHVRKRNPSLPNLTSVAIFAFRYSWICLILRYCFDSFFDFPQTTAIVASPRMWSVLIGVTFVGSILAVIAQDKFPRVGAVASAFVALLIIAKAISVLSYTRKFQGEALTLWFVAVGVLGTIELHLSYKRKKASKTPIGFLILAVGFIGTFAEIYYPHLKSSWGGGEGAVAVISFTKDFQSLPSGQVRVQVLQESNAGFYVAGPNGTRAVFIPRTAISLVTFSEEPIDLGPLQYHPSNNSSEVKNDRASCGSPR